MHPSRRRWRIAFGLGAAVLLLITLVLRTEKAGTLICEQLRERLPAMLDADVELGRCSIDPLTARVEVLRLSVTPHPAPEPLFTAERAAISLRGFFFGGISLQDVELVRPRVEFSLPLPRARQEPAVCPLVELSRLRIGRLKVIEGGLIVHHPDGRTLRLEGVGIDASVSRREATMLVEADRGALLLGQRELRLGKLAAEGSLDVEGARLELQRAELNVEGATATASGTVDDLCGSFPSLALTAQAYLPLDSLPRLGVTLPAPSGQVLARVSIDGKLDSPSVRAEVQGAHTVIGPFSPGDFSAKIVWSGKTVTIDDFVTQSGEGDVRLSGRLALTPGFPVSAYIETRNASFARILGRAGVPGAWVEFPATVKTNVTGSLGPSLSLAGDVDFRTGPFVLAARPWDAAAHAGVDILRFSSSSGHFRLGVTPQAVSFSEVRISVGSKERTQVAGDVKLLIGPSPGIEAKVRTDALDLSDFGSIAELPWSGVGQAQVNISGPFRQILVDGQTTLRDFKLRGYSLGVVQSPLRYSGNTLSFPAIAAQKGQTQYFGDVALSFLPEGMNVRSTVQLPDGRIEDVVDLLADLSPSIQTLKGGVLTGRLSALAAVDSPARELSFVIATRVREVHLFDRRLGASEMVLRFEGGEALILDPATFDGPLGPLAAEGRWLMSGGLDYRLALSAGSMAELVDPDSVNGLPIQGHLEALASVGGTTEATSVDVSLKSSDVTWAQHVLGDMKLDAHALGRDVSISGQLFPGVVGTASFVARNDWPFRAHLDAQLDDLSAFLTGNAASVAVRVGGTVDASGPLLDLSRASARANLSALSLSRSEVSATNTEPVRLSWNAGAIVVESLEMKGPTTELTVAGAWGPSTVDLKARGSVDLRMASSLSHLVERTSGRLDFAAAFEGAIGAPSLAGNATLSDGRFGLEGKDLSFKELSARAEFSESRIILQDAHGLLNDGRVRAHGDIRLEKLSMKGLEIEAELEDVPVLFQSDVPATIRGGVLLSSPNGESFLLSGRSPTMGIDIVKFRYLRPMTLQQLIANARERPVPNDDVPAEWLRFDVDLRASGDVRIENDSARARLGGGLRLTGTNVKPVFVGVVETQEGAQASFSGNTYKVQKGQLQFNGLWPTFELEAQSQVREYLVSVKAFGRLEDPKYSLSSEPPLSESDLVLLLTLGLTSRERLTERSGAGLAAGALLSASGLDQQVQRFLSQNVGLKDQQVKLTTSFNETTGTSEPAVTWEAKALSDRVKIGVTQPVTGRGTRAQGEWRFNTGVSLRGQWDNQTPNSPFGNPGMELRFRFEWE